MAVQDGSWFDPNTWQGGIIPDEGAKVLIVDGITVTYDQESDVRLDLVRVDGSLLFAHDVNTKIVVDTLFSTPGSLLQIGTAANPIETDKTAQILITNDGAIDTEWDPQQLSRGVVTHGTVRIFGADKLDFTSLVADAYAGDDILTLDSNGSPEGWQVGDRLVLGGTYYDENGNDADNTRFHDEVLEITAINGNQIAFINLDTGENTLRFNHQRPQGFEAQDLKLYIANTTRNISIASENPNAPIQQRGHVMFMHNPDVEVHNAGFYHLGRTDKKQLIDEPGVNIDGSVAMGLISEVVMPFIFIVPGLMI